MGHVEYAESWDRSEVWWSPDWQVWGLTAYTAAGDQVGDTEWFRLKSDAVADAGLYVDLGRCERAVVYTKNGKIGR